MAANADGDAPLVEGLHYTVEAGRWIFTAYYLKGRGSCCGSGCRNCPYGFSESAPPPGESGEFDARRLAPPADCLYD